MSQEVLAERIGLDRTMVAKIEAGRRRVDALELVRFASALDVPIDALLEPLPAVISRRSAPLEDDTTTDAGRNSYRINTVLADWLRDVRQLVEAGTLRPTPLMRYPHPVTSEDDARAAARWLRTAHGVGNDPIGSMLEFCERSGQYVLITEVPGDGTSLIDGDLAVAVVNHQTDPGRRRATAAHELGHSVLGDEYSSDLDVHLSRQDRESVINAFAAELLLPTAAFDRMGDRSALTRDKLVRLAAEYRVSWSLALRQAALAGWLDSATSRRWRQQTPTRAEFLDAVGWPPQPDLSVTRVPPGYSHAVMEAWWRGLVTSNRAVESLHGTISLEDLPARDDSDLVP